MLIQSDMPGVQQRARRLAAWYARRNGGVQLEDLQAEAVLAQVAAAGSYDASRGDWAGYAYRCASRAVLDAIRLRHPVSGRRRNLAESFVATRGVAFVDVASDGRVVERAAALRAVRDRLVLLLGEDDAAMALAVLSGEFRPADVARETGTEVRAIYAEEVRLRRVLRADYQLRALWEALR